MNNSVIVRSNGDKITLKKDASETLHNEDILFLVGDCYPFRITGLKGIVEKKCSGTFSEVQFHFFFNRANKLFLHFRCVLNSFRTFKTNNERKQFVLF